MNDIIVDVSDMSTKDAHLFAKASDREQYWHKFTVISDGGESGTGDRVMLDDVPIKGVVAYALHAGLDDIYQVVLTLNIHDPEIVKGQV